MNPILLGVAPFATPGYWLPANLVHTNRQDCNIRVVLAARMVLVRHQRPDHKQDCGNEYYTKIMKIKNYKLIKFRT